jgi:membrane protease YdiL (CAAX protease family)
MRHRMGNRHRRKVHVARNHASDGAAARRAPTLALVLVTLAAVNVLNEYGPRRTSLVLGPAAAAGLVLLARRAGLGWRELGLDRATWRAGLRWAAAGAGMAAVGYAAAITVPALRPAFRDARYDKGAAAALLTAFVIVPVGTVLFEEVAFRGVLWGLIRRDHGTKAATAVSSVLFGLWHVLSSLSLGKANEGVAAVAGGNGTTGRLGPAAGTVLFTGLAGVVLCELRRRSGSLLAPAGVHWAVNGLGVLAAAAVQKGGGGS